MPIFRWSKFFELCRFGARISFFVVYVIECHCTIHFYIWLDLHTRKKKNGERNIYEMKWNGFFVVHLRNLSFEWIVNFAFQFAPAFNSLPMRLAKVAVTINSYPKNGNNFHSKNSIECMLETEANGYVYAVCHLHCQMPEATVRFREVTTMRWEKIVCHEIVQKPFTPSTKSVHFVKIWFMLLNRKPSS